MQTQKDPATYPVESPSKVVGGKTIYNEFLLLVSAECEHVSSYKTKADGQHSKYGQPLQMGVPKLC